MKPFAALDEVFNTSTLASAPSREVTGASDFQPLYPPGALKARPETDADSHESPQIELIEAEGMVQQVIVTCRCGERTVLDCRY
jgi:hypothetical protein